MHLWFRSVPLRITYYVCYVLNPLNCQKMPLFFQTYPHYLLVGKAGCEGVASQFQLKYDMFLPVSQGPLFKRGPNKPSINWHCLCFTPSKRYALTTMRRNSRSCRNTRLRFRLSAFNYSTGYY
jgi:hypothetical protein